jgi:hypothetical protein
MHVRELECPSCDIQVRGHYRENEFARLQPDLLHFLRIFIVCEGKIRDMERALGVSYPTVKARLSLLKDALQEPEPEASPDEREAPLDVLSKIESGELSVTEGLKQLKKRD